MIVYKLSGCEFFQPLNLQMLCVFRAKVPSYSGNLRVLTHFKRVCDLMKTHIQKALLLWQIYYAHDNDSRDGERASVPMCQRVIAKNS